MIFSHLSGSLVENRKQFLFNALTSNMCYAGFAKSETSWGETSLIAIKLNPGVLGSSSTSFGWPKSYKIDATAISNNDKFYDKDSIKFNNLDVADYMRAIDIYRVSKTAAPSEFSIIDAELISDISANGNDVLLNHFNTAWIELENLSPYFLKELQVESNIDNYHYYITPKNAKCNSFSLLIDVRKTNESSYLDYQECDLVMTSITSGSSFPTSALPLTIANTLIKTVNILGEIKISGISVSGVNSVITNNSLSADYLIHSDTKFAIRNKFNQIHIIDDLSLLILDDTIFVKQDNEEFLTFSNKKLDETFYYKVLSDISNFKSLAIWNESNIFDSLNQISDANPPAIESSYLNMSRIEDSIFDIKGLYSILYSESTEALNNVFFAKEITNSERAFYSDSANLNFKVLEYTLDSAEKKSHSIKLKNNAAIKTNILDVFTSTDIVIGDRLVIKGQIYTISDIIKKNETLKVILSTKLISNIFAGNTFETLPTTVVSKVILAETNKYDLAKNFDFDKIILKLKIPKLVDGGPTDSIYRKFFITFMPKVFKDGNVNSVIPVNTPVSIKENNLIVKPSNNNNIRSYHYELGTLLYLSNKKPILRSMLTANEEFYIMF